MSYHRRTGGPPVTRLGATLGAALLTLASVASACAPQAAPSGWVPIEATLAVEHLAIPSPAEEAEPVTMPLAEAQAQLLFAFGLPVWTPEGFALQDEVEVVLPAESSQYATVILTWQNEAEEMITLQASVNAEAGAQLSGAGTVEQAQVNGQPATLTRLGLKSAPRRLSLNWDQNGVTYTLAVGGGVLSAEELIKMAESLQP
jgi:hypothetical protein